MKKVLLLFTALLISAQSFAQDPELIRDWRLLYLEVDGIVHDAPSANLPGVDPILHLDMNLYWAHIETCSNLLGGSVTYDTPNSSLTTLDHAMLVGDCEPVYLAYEIMYYDFLANTQTTWEPKTLGYEIIFNSNGSKTLILTDDDNDQAVYNSELLAIEQLSKVNFKIYPNPVSSTIFIASETLQIERLTIYSMSGQVVLAEKNNTNSVVVSGLSEGLYFLEIFSEEGKSVQKFIKDRCYNIE